MVTGKLPPTAYLEYLNCATNHKQTISDFRQCPIARVHEDEIVMNAWVKRRQLRRVQVTVKVRLATIPAIILDWILHADSMLAAPQLPRTACSYSTFHCQMNPHDAFISFLHDIMCNISKWVINYNPFASNHGIDDNLNQLDHPWILIVPLLFFLNVESLLC